MEYGYSQQSGGSLRGKQLNRLIDFLEKMGLAYDYRIEFTTIIENNAGEIVATASLQENVIKCVAVDSALQGEGLAATLLTAIRQEALRLGHRHLFLYTKPQNAFLFSSLGFYEIVRTDDVLLMEDRRNGFSSWVESVRNPSAHGVIGCIIMNCNPMTLGHCYLIEQAIKRCDFLYLFVLTEDKSVVPAVHRYRIVEQTVAKYPNIFVAETSRYLISCATFPDYFLKGRLSADSVWSDLDVAVFCRLAQELQISRRFVGTEPFCPVTASYNQAMAAAFPEAGIELIEIPRLEKDGIAISASAVRQIILDGQWENIHLLVPEATYTYFSDPENREIFLQRLEKETTPPQ